MSRMVTIVGEEDHAEFYDKAYLAAITGLCGSAKFILDLKRPSDERGAEEYLAQQIAYFASSIALRAVDDRMEWKYQGLYEEQHMLNGLDEFAISLSGEGNEKVMEFYKKYYGDKIQKSEYSDDT